MPRFASRHGGVRSRHLLQAPGCSPTINDFVTSYAAGTHCHHLISLSRMFSVLRRSTSKDRAEYYRAMDRPRFGYGHIPDRRTDHVGHSRREASSQTETRLSSNQFQTRNQDNVNGSCGGRPTISWWCCLGDEYGMSLQYVLEKKCRRKYFFIRHSRIDRDTILCAMDAPPHEQ